MTKIAVILVDSFGSCLIKILSLCGSTGGSTILGGKYKSAGGRKVFKSFLADSINREFPHAALFKRLNADLIEHVEKQRGQQAFGICHGESQSQNTGQQDKWFNFQFPPPQLDAL